MMISVPAISPATWERTVRRNVSNWLTRLMSTLLVSFASKRAFTVESYAFERSRTAMKRAEVFKAAITLREACSVCSPAWKPNCARSVVTAFSNSNTTAFPLLCAL